MSYTVLTGDCIEGMRTLADRSVHCCVTSPPYFRLRDYGHAGQIGLEASPDAFVAKLVEVFREVRRVLRDDGTVWLNLGDSYAGYWGSKYAHKPFGADRTPDASTPPHKASPDFKAWGVKNKDLMGIPWRVAFALQADGWYLRQDIIWHKPNPMPESVTDRCTKSHEYIFLLSKAPRYFYDADAIKEEAIHAGRVVKATGSTAKVAGDTGTIERRTSIGFTDHDHIVTDRNKRSVWTVTTRPYAAAHFATFPPALIEPCILAGCPVGGTVLDPFGGSGTTAQVALQHGREAILCELNPDYVTLIHERLSGLQYRIVA